MIKYMSLDLLVLRHFYNRVRIGGTTVNKPTVMLIVMWLALAGAATLVGISIENESASQHQQSRHRQRTHRTHKPAVKEKPGATNIVAFWFRRKNKSSYEEIGTLSKGAWLRSSAVSFITTAKGLRLMKAPQTEIYRLHVWYKNRNIPYSWNGKGMLPLAKTIPSISGNRHKQPLLKVKAYLYNPRINESERIRPYCDGCDNRPRSTDPPRAAPSSGQL
jgi:hypothetical protein